MRKRRLRFALMGLVGIPLLVAGIFVARSYFAMRSLLVALGKVEEARSRSDLESIMGYPPDVIVPASADAPEGLTQLYWARVVKRCPDGQSLDAFADLPSNRNEPHEKAPNTLLAGIWVHAYVTRKGEIFDIEAVDPEFLKEYFRGLIDSALFGLIAPPPPVPAAPAVLVGIVDPKFSGESNKETMPAPVKTKGSVVGSILFAGNSQTRDTTIRKLLGIDPGQPISSDQLKAAEKRLVDSGLFLVDPSRGVSPKVELLDPDGPSQYKDLLVTIAERF